MLKFPPSLRPDRLPSLPRSEPLSIDLKAPWLPLPLSEPNVPPPGVS